MALLRRLASRSLRLLPGRLCVLALSALLLASGAQARADTPIPAASQLKAVFLFNFAQFLTWPARAFPEDHSPIVIGVLGDDALGGYLDGLVKGEKIGERPLVVRRFQKVDEVADCHILFISHSAAADLDRVLTQMKGKPALTVGEEETFARHGGMVAFVAQPNGKIGLWINNTAAKSASLTISSRLLAHATLVSEDRN